MDIGVFSSPRTVDEFVAKARSIAEDGFGTPDEQGASTGVSRFERRG